MLGAELLKSSTEMCQPAVGPMASYRPNDINSGFHGLQYNYWQKPLKSNFGLPSQSSSTTTVYLWKHCDSYKYKLYTFQMSSLLLFILIYITEMQFLLVLTKKHQNSL